MPIPLIWGKKNVKEQPAAAAKHNRTEVRERLKKEDVLPSTRKINVSNRPGQSNGNLSLKQLLNPTSQKEEVAVSQTGTTDFSQDELYDKWRKFAYSVKAIDLDLYSTLTVNKPRLKEGYIVEVTIFNSAQEADINARKAELLGYLRKQLNNSSIDLEMVIDKEAESKGVYTIQDKYKKLVEKNPDIEILRKKFDLNF